MSTFDTSSREGRENFAKAAVHACLGAISDLLIEDMLCVVMDESDRVARLVSKHIARAVGEPYESQPGVYARPAPRELVLERRADLGERLVGPLLAPLAPNTMRVLWLTPRQRYVVDIPIDPHMVAAVNRKLDEGRLRDELGDEIDAIHAPERTISGTWRDPMRYLPMPLPGTWSLGSIDRLGVLSIIVDGRLAVEIAAVKAEPGKLLFVVMRRILGGGDVSEEEARGVVERLHNVRGGFKQLDDDEGIRTLFGEGRVFAARVAKPDLRLAST